MEAVSSQKSVHGGFLKEEKRTTHDQYSSSGDDEGCPDDVVLKSQIMPKMEISPAELQATVSNSYQKNQEVHARLKSAKAEMGEVMEENQRLRKYLDRIMKDYRALQMQFNDTMMVVQQENKPSGSSSVTTHHHHHHEEIDDQESDQFVSLSLGRMTPTASTTDHMKKDDHQSPTHNKNSSTVNIDINDHVHHKVDKAAGSLTLGLDCKLELPSNEHLSPNPSPEASSEEVKEDVSGEKGPKTMRTGDDEVCQQNPAKRARVSVRVRCDTPTMNDGCQWRKYGQKIAKGNPCPRAYYRCTVAPNCPVRKQVQRCAEDLSILITTYEGTHNHPLPISATAIASTTSAAASMLMSGSSSSGTALSQSATNSLITSANINGLNFYVSDNSKTRPFYNLPNSSISSSSPSFPTITLDLTNSNSSASSHLSKLGNFPPRYNSNTTSLNFSSLESTSLPISWSNGVLSYGNQHQPLINNIKIQSVNNGSLSFGRQQPPHHQETLYQSFLQKNNTILNSNQHSHHQLPPETLAAATKAITSDPNFQSALAAALTTIIGSGTAGTNGNNSNQLAAEKLISDQTFPILSSFPAASTSNTNKCAPSFLNKSSPSTNNSQSGSLMFSMSPSLPFSTSNSKSSSPGGDHNRDHISS